MGDKQNCLILEAVFLLFTQPNMLIICVFQNYNVFLQLKNNEIIVHVFL